MQGELKAIGEAFSKYRPEDFPSYPELQPLIVAMSSRTAMEMCLQDALGQVRQNRVGSLLTSTMDEIVKDIEPHVRALLDLANAASAQAGIVLPARREA